MSLRIRVFLAALGVALASVLLCAVLVARAIAHERAEQTAGGLVAQARLVAELIGRRPAAARDEVDAEADAAGARLDVRVTLVDVDGTVVGDTMADGAALAAMENHAARPEIAEAGRDGVAVVRRFSTTLDEDMVYAAVAVDHPSVRVVRLAVSVAVADRSAVPWGRALGAGLLLAVAGAAALACWVSARATRQVRAVTALARRAGAEPVPTPGRGPDDEVGPGVRALDAAIDQQRRDLAELARDRRVTEAILSSLAEGVVVVDAGGHVQVANEAARRMLQIAGNPLGRSYLELIRHPDITRQIGRALDGDTPSHVEITLPTEPITVCRASVASYVAPDAPGVALVLHDVSDYRRADQIRQDFVANVSHELRTPLTAIRGAVETLADEPPPEPGRFLQMIGRQTARMERLVVDLLRLARLDAGQETVALAPCATAALLGGVEADLATVLLERRQRMEVRIQPGAETMLADPVKLHDVVRNLLENAARYAPPDGTIDVEATADEAGDAVTLTVADRGPGIPTAELSRVFERFYRVDRSRARDPGGTGLGLSIVKHLVSLHGGTVRATQRPGGGTVVTVRLPQRAV